MKKQQTTPELPENIAIPHPDGSTARVIRLVRSGSDRPMSPDEEIILAQYREIERLKSQRVTAAPQEGESDCGCEACKPQGTFLNPANTRMIVCAICGNKRCPHATDHRNACTNSNEPGQPGSSWENIKPFRAPESPQPLAPPDTGNVGAIPVHWRALLSEEQRPQQPATRLHVVGFGNKRHAEGWIAEQRDFKGWNYTLEDLYAAPPGRGMVPMTESRMDEVLADFVWDCPKSVLREAGRAVEAEHGIAAPGSGALGDGGRDPATPQGGDHGTTQ